MADVGGEINGGGGEIMLFGVRVVVDSMRKCVSLNNLSQYEQQQRPPLDSPQNYDVAAGYASADDAVPRSSSSSNNRERKRGVAWTEEEHKRFLIGLKKLGKGDWRGIAKNFVLTRTPTQVASHAQKYYIRRSNVNRRRRRSSLFDITTDSVAAAPTSDQHTNQDEASQSPAFVSTQTTSNSISTTIGSQITSSMVYPLTIGPVVADRSVTDYNHLLPTQIAPIPQKPARITTADHFDLNMNSGSEPSLSLNLSLSSSSDQGSLSPSSRQAKTKQHSGFGIMTNSRASIMGMA